MSNIELLAIEARKIKEQCYYDDLYLDKSDALKALDLKKSK